MINWERRSDALKAIHDAALSFRPITLFGSATMLAVDNWQALGYIEPEMDGQCYITYDIPAGKTLKLYALGQLYCSDPANANIKLTKDGLAQTVAELGLGEKFKTFNVSVAGPAVGFLLGFTHGAEFDRVGGFMVFSIE